MAMNEEVKSITNIERNLEEYKKELIETLKMLDNTIERINEYETMYTKFSRSFYETKLLYLKERREILEKLAKIDMEYKKQFKEDESKKVDSLIDAIKS